MSTNELSIIHFTQSALVATPSPPLGAQSAECTQYRDTYIRGNISRLAGQEQLLLWALPVWAAGTSQSASRGKTQ